MWPKAFGAYSPDRAPLMVAYRLQMDSGTVAVQAVHEHMCTHAYTHTCIANWKCSFSSVTFICARFLSCARALFSTLLSAIYSLRAARTAPHFLLISLLSALHPPNVRCRTGPFPGSPPTLQSYQKWTKPHNGSLRRPNRSPGSTARRCCFSLAKTTEARSAARPTNSQ